MLKVGLVGYGFMGHMHAQCYEATGEAKVAALADVDEARRTEASAKLGCETYTSLREMLDASEVDVVDICVPTYLHEEMVIAVTKAGRAMLCEKPMSLTVESCDRMIAAVRQAGVKFMAGHVIRFWPEYQAVKKIVDSGECGKVRWVSAQRRSPFPSHGWQNWFADPGKSGGAVLDLHIHDLDFISYLIGSPKKLDALGAISEHGAVDGVQTLGWGHRDGVTSCAEGTFDLAPEFPFNMALLVACEGATIKFDMASNPTLMIYPFQGEPYAPELPRPSIGQSTEAGGNISDLGGYYNEIKYFIDCLKAGKNPDVVTPEDAREAVRLCLAADKSVRSESIISV